MATLFIIWSRRAGGSGLELSNADTIRTRKQRLARHPRKQQINWAAPTTVLKRCPAFAVPKDADAPKELTKGEKDRMALAAALVLQARARQAQDEGGPGQSLALTGCKARFANHRPRECRNMSSASGNFRWGIVLQKGYRELPRRITWLLSL
jgi:hypothetical protein